VRGEEDEEVGDSERVDRMAVVSYFSGKTAHEAGGSETKWEQDDSNESRGCANRLANGKRSNKQ
jgi:hypothetical protein